MADTTLQLEGDLTIRRAVEIRDAIVAALDHSGEVVLDLSGATDMDVSFLQILVAAKRTAATERKSLRLASSDGSPLADRAMRCGLEPSLLPLSA